jgi:hypothetical protein
MALALRVLCGYPPSACRINAELTSHAGRDVARPISKGAAHGSAAQESPAAPSKEEA